MKKLFRWLIVLWFVVYSALFTPLAYAASPAGWAFNSFNVATSVVTALKGGASASVAVAKSPISQKIAKGIVGGVIAGAALPLAISQISGIALNAVDWVLDPANNQIKYAPKGTAILPYSVVGSVYTGVGASPADACKDYVNYMVKYNRDINGVTFDSHVYVKATDTQCFMTYYADADTPSDFIKDIAFDPNNDYKTIPIPTLADKIYDNAKTDTASASVVNQAVKDYVNEGSADTALDAAKADADATHNCGTGTHWSGSACVADTPSTPDTPFDPSSIIDAIKGVFDAVMSLPDVINNALDSLLVDIKDFFQPVVDSVTDMIDWFKSDPDPQTDSKPDIDTTQPTKSATDFDTYYLQFGGQCPEPVGSTLQIGAVAVPLSLDMTPLCDFSVLVRPAILAMAYLAALFVVARSIGETQ